MNLREVIIENLQRPQVDWLRELYVGADPIRRLDAFLVLFWSRRRLERPEDYINYG
jgi:hypothetical protein